MVHSIGVGSFEHGQERVTERQYVLEFFFATIMSNPDEHGLQFFPSFGLAISRPKQSPKEASF
jgi:hypothetical protein